VARVRPSPRLLSWWNLSEGHWNNRRAQKVRCRPQETKGMISCLKKVAARIPAKRCAPDKLVFMLRRRRGGRRRGGLLDDGRVVGRDIRLAHHHLRGQHTVAVLRVVDRYRYAAPDDFRGNGVAGPSLTVIMFGENSDTVPALVVVVMTLCA
jgi:hypothetical protein